MPWVLQFGSIGATIVNPDTNYGPFAWTNPANARDDSLSSAASIVAFSDGSQTKIAAARYTSHYHTTIPAGSAILIGARVKWDWTSDNVADFKVHLQRTPGETLYTFTLAAIGVGSFSKDEFFPFPETAFSLIETQVYLSPVARIFGGNVTANLYELKLIYVDRWSMTEQEGI